MFIEQHTYLDLDDDGYKEPYIVTFHKDTRRFSASLLVMTIRRCTSMMKVSLLRLSLFSTTPNMASFLILMEVSTTLVLACLLGPINESVNTLINQLIDSGTINNMQAGFVGKGLRLRMGETKFKPGEWKAVNSYW
jgi:hypothetical protein